MPRSARAAVGGVVVLVLLLVAAVSGLVAAVGAAQVRGGWWASFESAPSDEWFTDPVTVEAEVLDVDGDQGDGFGWASVDVVFDTDGGGREVAVVDLGEQDGASPPLPQVGDTLTVVHERSDPSYAMREDDPMLTGGTDGTGGTADTVDEVPGVTAEQAREAGEALVARTRALAIGSLVLAVLVGVLTVVAVRRAPPARGWSEPPPPGAPSPVDAPGR